MVVLPQVIVALAILWAAFGLASVPLWRRPSPERRAPFGRIVPHPRDPGSMLSFAALPSFLVLMTIVHIGLGVVPLTDPINSPGSFRRLSEGPRGADVDLTEVNGSYHFVYPRNTGDLTANAAHRVESGPRWQRIRAMRDLAWWTSVCPNYVPFTVPRLAAALRDPDPAVKGAAAIGLGSTGGHGATAIPDLLAARGTSVRYFDYVIEEAVFLIEHTPRWPPADECENMPMEELERRALQELDAADETQAPCR